MWFACTRAIAQEGMIRPTNWPASAMLVTGLCGCWQRSIWLLSFLPIPDSLPQRIVAPLSLHGGSGYVGVAEVRGDELQIAGLAGQPRASAVAQTVETKVGHVGTST